MSIKPLPESLGQQRIINLQRNPDSRCQQCTGRCQTRGEYNRRSKNARRALIEPPTWQ